MKTTKPYMGSLGNITIILVGLILCSCIKPKVEELTNLEERVEKIINSIKEPIIPADTIDLIQYSGKQPDKNGTVDFHHYINEAIDILSERGGGTLLFSHTWGLENWRKYPEVYRIKGAIELKSNIELLIDPSIILQFEFDPPSYLPNGKGVINRYEGSAIISYSGLIRAFNAKNISIKARTGGSGAPPEIRGDGFSWQKWSWDGQVRCKEEGREQFYNRIREVNHQSVPLKDRIFIDTENDFFRPVTMEFFLCQNVLVDGIKISNSPFWCVHPVFSKDMIFRNMIFSSYGANNDGIDPESSKNILIENIVFGNQDDNVAIKAGRDLDGRDGVDITGTLLEDIDSEYIVKNNLKGATENVIIRNCQFKGHYAVCIGSEMSGGVRNIFVINNSSIQDVNMGFFIKSSRKRGGGVENIYIDNLSLNIVEKDVICIIPNYDNDSISKFPPTFKNIHISNISARQAKDGIRLYGWPDAVTQNVFLRNIQINSVREKDLEVGNVEDIELDNVTIKGKRFNGFNTVKDNKQSAPSQN
ncbi:glycosyl hydrolase family 28 protein [uncultured Draconibacterium sp.]|uniref:glycoside hydrolase family 28 protein n=1 Tax=uncultured Draconibacterium sp. TaxID=1573823 RepID=UPI0029C95A02|nr:glycosyl hydrolase family 28 protein [uncultured Draconibacterium sp.]